MRLKTSGVLGSVTGLAAVVALLAAPGATATGNDDGLRAFGLTNNDRLLRFSTAQPAGGQVIGKVSGLIGDTTLVGIDFRVQNEKLYGVGNRGGIYTIATRTAQAARVSQITVPLAGDTFGVDFNPAADRLRVISDTGQNLRHDVNPGGVTTVDGTLTYPPEPATATGVNGAAYTNNDLNADTSTTLYDLDTNLDQVAIQSPANSGQLAATGKLGEDATRDAGFDIYSEVVNGRTEGLRAFATLQVDGTYQLYRVTLFTGDVEPIGRFPGKVQVSDLAVRLNQVG